jgi:hypothetical protein
MTIPRRSDRRGTHSGGAEPRACSWQTAYGLPWAETCGTRTLAPHLYCAEHERDHRDLYPHLPVPLRGKDEFR